MTEKRSLLVLVLYGLTLSHAALLFPQEVKVNEGSGFIVWMTAAETVSRCDLQFRGKNLTGTTSFGVIKELEEKSATECAFRVKNVPQNATGKWNVVQYDEDNLGSWSSFDVTVTPADPADPSPISPKSVEVDQGDTEVEFKGVLPTVKRLQDGSQDTFLEYKVDSKRNVKSCIATHKATDRRFNLQTGAGYSNYWSRNTILANGQCQMQFAALTDQDLGIWEMSMDNETHPFIILPDANKAVPIRSDEVKLNVTCAQKLSYPLRRCYLQSNHTGDAIIFKTREELKSAVCQFEITRDKEWYCGYNGPQRTDEDIITRYKVVSGEDTLITKVVATGEKAIASAEVIHRAPIKHCIISEPQGKLYQIAKDHGKGGSEDFIYSGNGLAQGECSILVNLPVNPGRWTFNLLMEDNSVQKGEFILEDLWDM